MDRLFVEWGDWYHVPYQPFGALPVCFGQHNGLGYVFVLVQYAFDLAQLDTVSPDLYLVVDTSQIFDVPICLPPRQVACFIQPGFGSVLNGSFINFSAVSSGWFQ